MHFTYRIERSNVVQNVKIGRSLLGKWSVTAQKFIHEHTKRPVISGNVVSCANISTINIQ